MMFESKRDKEATITLCIFPHLRQFVAVDARPQMPGRPAIKVLDHNKIMEGRFKTDVERDFSKLLSRPDLGFLGFAALPQEVEGLLRLHALRRVLECLNDDVRVPDPPAPGGVGVMFFSGGLLAVDDEQLSEIIADVFEHQLGSAQRRELHTRLTELLSQERQAVADSARSELAKLIMGEGGPYVTLWGREGQHER